MTAAPALVPVTSTPVATSRGHLSPEAIKSDVDAVKDLMRAALTEGIDFGRIPNTPKPTLFKPGAEQLIKFFRLGHTVARLEVERDTDGRPFGVTYRCTVYPLGDEGTVIADGEGYCGYDEPDKEAHQTAYGKNVPRAAWNTVMQMAIKRAVVSTVLRATATSGLFTQDLEELVRDVPIDPEAIFRDGGWDGRDEHDTFRASLTDVLRAATPVVQQEFRTWRTAEGIDISKPVTRAQAEAINARLVEMGVVDGTPEPDSQVQPPAVPAPEGDSDEICGSCGDDLTLVEATADPLAGETSRWCADCLGAPFADPAPTAEPIPSE